MLRSMVSRNSARRPCIAYRPIKPSDLEALEQLHLNLFPIRYESEFFCNVVNHNDIISWGAVDRNRPNAQSDELIGFVTIKIVLARESEISDLIRCDSGRTDQTLVYILTLGVVEAYRKFGIASALIGEVTRYARTIPTCRAVYLHVISYNNPAIFLYNKLSFKCVRRLHGFYLIDSQHYDAYLFVYYVNGGHSPCSPLELAVCVVNYLRTSLKSVTARLWRRDERKPWRWTKCKESCGLIAPQGKNLSIDGSAEFQRVIWRLESSSYRKRRLATWQSLTAL
ncbi:histone acetyltransferase MCC1 isoform X2 [Silene latifolia]|uniref:histone acetyltransferase MCC1 isoform X2 n=1 Tax=Silene latifolia TaxID=37657 RepID=UPI003D77D96B